MKSGTKLLNAVSRKMSTASVNVRSLHHADSYDCEDDFDEEEQCCGCVDSVKTQLDDLSHEVNSTMEFLSKAYKILMRTSAATICLAIAIIVPVLMTYFGLKYLEDCPIEPHIPIYLLVGGGFGIVNLLYLIWRHSVKRYSENNDIGRDASNEIAKSSKVLDAVNMIFLLGWFACGNYWVFSVYGSVRMESSYQRRTWCHKNAYWFALAQITAGNFFIVLIAIFLLGLVIFYRTHRYRPLYI